MASRYSPLSTKRALDLIGMQSTVKINKQVRKIILMVISMLRVSVAKSFLGILTQTDEDFHLAFLYIGKSKNLESLRILTQF